MEPHYLPHSSTDPEPSTAVGYPLAEQARAHRTRWALLSLALVLAVAGAGRLLAHWIPPETIIANLSTDGLLREKVGVRRVERQGRVLILRVDHDVWARLPADDRRALAEEWLRVWRHNVDQGVVAVVRATDDQPLVNYDATGHARLIDER
jgi:hypothetical protein